MGTVRLTARAARTPTPTTVLQSAAIGWQVRFAMVLPRIVHFTVLLPICARSFLRKQGTMVAELHPAVSMLANHILSMMQRLLQGGIE